MICRICNDDYPRGPGFAKHLRAKHGITNYKLELNRALRKEQRSAAAHLSKPMTFEIRPETFEIRQEIPPPIEADANGGHPVSRHDLDVLIQTLETRVAKLKTARDVLEEFFHGQSL